MARCNHDCFNCKFDDCKNDTITRTEKMESSKRDRDYTYYGQVLKARPNKAKLKGRKI